MYSRQANRLVLFRGLVQTDSRTVQRCPTLLGSSRGRGELSQRPLLVVRDDSVSERDVENHTFFSPLVSVFPSHCPFPHFSSEVFSLPPFVSSPRRPFSFLLTLPTNYFFVSFSPPNLRQSDFGEQRLHMSLSNLVFFISTCSVATLFALVRLRNLFQFSLITNPRSALNCVF